MRFPKIHWIANRKSETEIKCRHYILNGLVNLQNWMTVEQMGAGIDLCSKTLFGIIAAMLTIISDMLNLVTSISI